MTWTEENSEREAQDRLSPCEECGAMQPVGFGDCLLCGFKGGPRITYLIPTPTEEERTCPGCDQKVFGRHGHAHNADCPQIAWVIRRNELENERRKHTMRRHPSAQLPRRVLGDRIWDEEQERYTSRGEEFGP